MTLQKPGPRTQLAALCTLCTLLVLAMTWSELRGDRDTILARTELRFRDFLARSGRLNPPDPRLIFLGIDNESTSIEQVDLDQLYADVPRDSADFHALDLISRQWPWPREVYGLILDKLTAAGARVVVFDLLFPKESPSDEPFRAALDRHHDQVLVGGNFERAPRPGDKFSWGLAMPTDSLIPQTTPLDPRVGYVNFWPSDFDEEVRRARFHATEEGLNLQMPGAHSEVFTSLAARAVTALGEGQFVPPEPDADYLFRFSGAPGKGFRPQSVYEIFVPRYWARNFANGDAFRGKIVLVGPAGNWQHDEHQTPFGLMPGPELHLNAMNALLHRAFLRELPNWVTLAAILAAGILAWLINVLTTRPGVHVALLLLLTAGTLYGALLLHDHADLDVAAVPPLIALNFSGGACFLWQFVRARLERAHTRRMMERYVSRDVVKELLDTRSALLQSLGGQRKPVTVLFSDLRGFTTLSENADPATLVTQLNEYFQQMVRHVFAQRGTLDKFLGDGLMAHWGSIVHTDPRTDAAHAVRTARAMCHSIAGLNEGWQRRGLPQLRLGIGINHGDAIVGNIGCEEKMEVSVIGDAVNLASRIESVTKLYQLELLIGEPVAALVADQFILRTVDFLQVMGKTRPVEVFAVLAERGGGSAEPPWLPIYEQAVRDYRHRQFTTAIAAFQQVLAQIPGDRLAAQYLQRSEDYQVNPPPADWNGVFVMRSK